MPGVPTRIKLKFGGAKAGDEISLMRASTSEFKTKKFDGKFNVMELPGPSAPFALGMNINITVTSLAPAMRLAMSIDIKLALGGVAESVDNVTVFGTETIPGDDRRLLKLPSPS